MRPARLGWPPTRPGWRLPRPVSSPARLAVNPARLAAGPAASAGSPASPAGLKAAAVAVCVVFQHDTPALLITRAPHPAQPRRAVGATRRAPGAGETAEDAARRELHEETGRVGRRGDVLGLLDDYVTRSGYLITPVVVWGGPVDPAMRGPESEVAGIHVIPLADFDVPPRLVRIPESDRAGHPAAAARRVPARADGGHHLPVLPGRAARPHDPGGALRAAGVRLEIGFAGK